MKKMVLVPFDQYSAQATKTQPPVQIEGEKQTHQVLPTEIPKQNDDPHRLNKDLILQPFGKHQRRDAETILQYAERAMDWNARGEIIVDGALVEGSHITDLIKDALVNYKNFNPIGFEVFYGALNNIPLSIIKNVNRRPLINPKLAGLLVGGGKNTFTQGSRTTATYPPPGLPINKTAVDITSNSWLTNWKQYG